MGTNFVGSSNIWNGPQTSYNFQSLSADNFAVQDGSNSTAVFVGTGSVLPDIGGLTGYNVSPAIKLPIGSWHISVEAFVGVDVALTTPTFLAATRCTTDSVDPDNLHIIGMPDQTDVNYAVPAVVLSVAQPYVLRHLNTGFNVQVLPDATENLYGSYFRFLSCNESVNAYVTFRNMVVTATMRQPTEAERDRITDAISRLRAGRWARADLLETRLAKLEASILDESSSRRESKSVVSGAVPRKSPKASSPTPAASPELTAFRSDVKRLVSKSNAAPADGLDGSSSRKSGSSSDKGSRTSDRTRSTLATARRVSGSKTTGDGDPSELPEVRSMDVLPSDSVVGRRISSQSGRVHQNVRGDGSLPGPSSRAGRTEPPDPSTDSDGEVIHFTGT